MDDSLGVVDLFSKDRETIKYALELAWKGEVSPVWHDILLVQPCSEKELIDVLLAASLVARTYPGSCKLLMKLAGETTISELALWLLTIALLINQSSRECLFKELSKNMVNDCAIKWFKIMHQMNKENMIREFCIKEKLVTDLVKDELFQMFVFTQLKESLSTNDPLHLVRYWVSLLVSNPKPEYNVGFFECCCSYFYIQVCDDDTIQALASMCPTEENPFENRLRAGTDMEQYFASACIITQLKCNKEINILSLVDTFDTYMRKDTGRCLAAVLGFTGEHETVVKSIVSSICIMTHHLSAVGFLDRCSLSDNSLESLPLVLKMVHQIHLSTIHICPQCGISLENGHARNLILGGLRLLATNPEKFLLRCDGQLLIDLAYAVELWDLPLDKTDAWTLCYIHHLFSHFSSEVFTLNEKIQLLLRIQSRVSVGYRAVYMIADCLRVCADVQNSQVTDYALTLLDEVSKKEFFEQGVSTTVWQHLELKSLMNVDFILNHDPTPSTIERSTVSAFGFLKYELNDSLKLVNGFLLKYVDCKIENCKISSHALQLVCSGKFLAPSSVKILMNIVFSPSQSISDTVRYSEFVFENFLKNDVRERDAVKASLAATLDFLSSVISTTIALPHLLQVNFQVYSLLASFKDIAVIKLRNRVLSLAATLLTLNESTMDKLPFCHFSPQAVEWMVTHISRENRTKKPGKEIQAWADCSEVDMVAVFKATFNLVHKLESLIKQVDDPRKSQIIVHLQRKLSQFQSRFSKIIRNTLISLENPRSGPVSNVFSKSSVEKIIQLSHCPLDAPPTQVKKRKVNRLRSNNAFVDAALEHEADDNYVDLEDFIVCDDDMNYY